MTLMANTKQEKILNYGSFQHSAVVEQVRAKNTMKCLIVLQICTTLLTLSMIGIFYFVAYPVYHKEKHHPFTTITPIVSTQNGSLSVLYALDPIGHSFCFRDGLYGEQIISWTVYNRCSDLDFNGYYKGNFTTAIEGGRLGTIIDLGTPDELQRKYKYSETVGKGQGYASIRRENKTLFILKSSGSVRTFQSMDESRALFHEPKSSATIPIKLEHIYALRIVDRYDMTFERVVKMFVVAYEPNVSVTIRWEVLV
ncbi:hypothetical protein I4U23_015850 [Adineta vaga]|nr:hypothetical protein I4U23_015850 [Adineta vaga]